MSTASFAANPPVNEKVISSFNEVFPGVVNAKWYEYSNYYEVVFVNHDISHRIKYGLQGEVLSVRRDYTEKDLPLFILSKVKSNYKGKRIFGVTEITSEESVSYNIVLEDAKQWITVKSDEIGNMSVVRKLKKA
jgi:hypothetical protein